MQCVALGLNDESHPVGADGVLVLQGDQGLAKTSFFRIMSPFPRWFVEGAIIDMSNKDTHHNRPQWMDHRAWRTGQYPEKRANVAEGIYHTP